MWIAVFGPRHVSGLIQPRNTFVSDLLGILVPSRFQAVSTHGAAAQFRHEARCCAMRPSGVSSPAAMASMASSASSQNMNKPTTEDSEDAEDQAGKD